MTRTAISNRYDYINEESISERLKCMICSNPFIDPVKTKCKPKEHTFCHHCIKDWLQRSSSCPSCRQNLKIQELTLITEGILLDMLNELSVQCLVCEKTGLERGNFDEHIKKHCMMETVACSSADVKCPWTGSSKNREQHLKTCPYTALRPMLIQMIKEKKQLQEQINQLQQETQQYKEQTKPPRRPMPNPSTGKFSENPAKSSMPCRNCSDCWRGAVRGSYFRGETGGGLKHGTTLVSCDCNCHK